MYRRKLKTSLVLTCSVDVLRFVKAFASGSRLKNRLSILGEHQIYAKMLRSLCGFRHPLGASSCGSLWLGECLPGNVDLGVNLIVDVLLCQFFRVVYLQLKQPAGNRTAWSDKDTRNTDLHILNIKKRRKKRETEQQQKLEGVGGGGGGASLSWHRWGNLTHHCSLA